MSYYERKEYEKVTAEMERLNAEKDKLDARLMSLAQSGEDLAALEAVSVQMGAIVDKLDAASDRWMELAELAGDL
eukprot:26286-Chlamydomonas_euryale.AAC.2